MITWNATVVAGSFPQLQPIASSTFTSTGGSMTVTLAAVAGKLTFIEGFDLYFGSCSVASNSSVSITGPTNTLYYDVGVPAGTDTVAGTRATDLVVRFPEPLPASASNTAIVISSSSVALATTGTLTAYGFTAPLASGQT
jgi:hypothetical protein